MFIRLTHVSGARLTVSPSAVVMYHSGRHGTEVIINCEHHLARQMRNKARYALTVVDEPSSLDEVFFYLAAADQEDFEPYAPSEEYEPNASMDEVIAAIQRAAELGRDDGA